ncbi:MAG: hypothetical protein R3E69_00975 [Steroidobacteraceae bacterium]
MATLLRIVGALWAVVGVLNLIGMPWRTSGQGLLTFGLMFNVLLFILPGLVVIGIGEAISRRSKQQPPASPQAATQSASIQERLTKLDDLLSSGSITAQEHASRRAEILKEV